MGKQSKLLGILICMVFGLWVGHDLGELLAKPLGPVSSQSSGFTELSWQTLPASKGLEWTDCYTGRQCARLVVPLNHSEPDGLEATIALIRRPAAIPPHSKFYKGPILFNPGGPGGSGVDMIKGPDGDLFARIVGPQFDVVGFDPRGVSRSTPRVSLFKTDVEEALFGLKRGVVNSSAEGVAREWARWRVVGQLAAEIDDGYLRHINTDQTARDMLRIVEAHGRSKIQYWGFSYGSVLGASFAAMFPDKIERLIIDAVVDSENYYATLWSNNLLDTNKVFESFLTGCVEAGPDECKFWAPSEEDIRNNLTSLYNSVQSQPVPVKTETNYGLLDYSSLRNIVFRAFYSPYETFVPLAEGLAALAAGDGSVLFESEKREIFKCSCNDKETSVNMLAASTAILCNDGDDVPGDLKSSEEYFKSLVQSSTWGDIWAGIRTSCVGWPRFPKDHFQGPFKANTSHPILLIGNTADPVTPLWAAKKMSQGFAGSVVLTQNSPGHGSISAPSLCTQKYVRQYFVDGTLPDPGTICEPIGKPFSTVLSSGSGNENDQKIFEVVTEMTPEDTEIFYAVLELSKSSVIPFHL